MTSPGVGSLRLTDEMFFLTHDERSGRPRSRAKDAIGLSLAGARLAEVLLDGTLHLADGRLVTTRKAHVLPDQLALCRRIYDEPELADVRTALRFFARDARDETGERLVSEQFVTRVVRRRLHGPPAIWYPAVDRNEAAWRSVRLARLLTERQPMTWQDVTLAGLMHATGLLDSVLWDDRSGGKTHLHRLLTCAPAPLRELVAEVSAALGARLMADRR